MCSVDSVRLVCQPTNFSNIGNACAFRVFLKHEEDLFPILIYHRLLIEKPLKLDLLLTGIKKSHNLYP